MLGVRWATTRTGGTKPAAEQASWKMAESGVPVFVFLTFKSSSHDTFTTPSPSTSLPPSLQKIIHPSLTDLLLSSQTSNGPAAAAATSSAPPVHPGRSLFYLGADVRFLSNRAGPFLLQPRGIQWTHGSLSGRPSQPSTTCVSFILLKLVPTI